MRDKWNQLFVFLSVVFVGLIYGILRLAWGDGTLAQVSGIDLFPFVIIFTIWAVSIRVYQVLLADYWENHFQEDPPTLMFVVGYLGGPLAMLALGSVLTIQRLEHPDA